MNDFISKILPYIIWSNVVVGVLNLAFYFFWKHDGINLFAGLCSLGAAYIGFSTKRSDE